MQADLLDHFRKDLISPRALKERNPFSNPVKELDTLPQARAIYDKIKHSIDTKPAIHFLRDEAYHTPRHYRATGLIALEIGRFNRLPTDKLDLLVSTAFLHDYGYKLLTSKTYKDAMNRHGAWRSLNTPLERQHILLAHVHGLIDDAQSDRMEDLNMATVWSQRQKPMTLLQRCLSDADVVQSCLSRENHAVETKLLKAEAALTGAKVSHTFLADVGPFMSCVRHGEIHPFEQARRALCQPVPS